MRRTLLIAILTVAMIAGLAAYASAANQNVVVTARVNPAFSMTINNNAVSFTDLNLGSPYSDSSTLITVKSNKLWDFSKTNVVDPLLTPILAESTDVGVGTGLAKGVTPITATYDLDLAADAAYDLEPGTDYTATYTYTAVQQ